jgi:hypothetical protein
MYDPNQNFQITLARVGDEMHLQIRDVASMKMVLEANLSPEAFMNFISGRETGDGIPAWFLPEAARLMVGRYPATVTRVLAHDEQTKDDALFDRWIDGLRRFILMAEEAGEPRKRGGGGGEISVSFRSYFPTKEQAEVWREQAQRVLDASPTPRMMEKSLGDESR